MSETKKTTVEKGIPQKRIITKISLTDQESHPHYAEEYISGAALKEKVELGLDENSSHSAEMRILGRELGARKFARSLARMIGNHEWVEGNTKYAFEAYEAACVAPSEILEKAEALLEAESLTLSWENEIRHLIEGKVRVEGCKTFDTRNLLGYADVLTGACVYCPLDDCSFCSQKKVLNRSYANKIQEALEWNYLRPKEVQNDGGNITREKIVEDRFSEYFLHNSTKPKIKYRAAAVAALKLVNRLDSLYLTEEDYEIQDNPE